MISNDRSPHTSTESSQEIIYRKMRNKHTTTTPYNSDVMQKQKEINPRTYTQIHPPTVVQAGGGGGKGWMESSPKFLICCSISKRFYP